MNIYEYNKNLFGETQQLSKGVYLDDTLKALENTEVYSDLHKLYFTPKWREQTVEFTTHDTIEQALLCGNNTAVLNFADALTPGGLVLQGETTQEEAICRYTNLYNCL